jgi:hypothetical protein
MGPDHALRLQIYVYYELNKFYQNHKRYVRSRDDNQLAKGGTGSAECAPQQYVNGTLDPSLPHDGAINPCGLIAWSFFNDSFSASVLGPGAAAAAPLTGHSFDVRSRP